MNNIERLRELTEKLPEVVPLEAVVQLEDGRYVEYDVLRGFCSSYGLYNNEQVAVARSVATGGTLFPKHDHGEHEFVIVVQGSGRITIGENEVIEFEGPFSYTFLPGVSHEFEFDTMTKMICVTVPASKGFPDGER
jgi:quercetin dioxygenase-like cupin family protein